MDDQPPETEYSQAEVLAPMEAEVVDTIAALPDFPGFSSRSWDALACSHNGIDNTDYVNIEIMYSFSEADATDPLVREDYVDTLRDRWTGLGYDVHRDEPSGTGKYYAIEARRDDGINLWYRVMNGVALTVQSGCVPVSDPSDIEYIPPTGGVEPGSKWDAIRIDDVQGVPERKDEDSSDEDAEFASPSGMVPWARDPDPTEPGPNPFTGHL